MWWTLETRVMQTFQLSFLDQLLDTQLDDRAVLSTDNSFKFEKALQEFSTAKYYCLDLETYGPDAGDGLNFLKNNIRMVQVGLPSGIALLVDLGGYLDNRKQIKNTPHIKKFFKIFKYKFAKEDVKIIGHNLLFDLIQIKYHFGLDCLNQIRDTFIMSMLMWQGVFFQKNQAHSLGGLYSRVFQKEVDKSLQVSDFGGKLSIDQLNYCVKDAIYPIELVKKLGKQAVETNQLEGIIAECNAIPCWVDLIINGFPVDTQLLDQLITEYERGKDIVSMPFTQTFPGVKLTTSPGKLAPLLNDTFGLKLESTKAVDLIPHKNISEVASILAYRSIKTHLDYLHNIKKALRADTNCVLGNFKQMTSRSLGRSACGKNKKSSQFTINLQNPPKKTNNPQVKALGLDQVRSVFRAPEGYKLVVIDLSSAHARIAAKLSKDTELVQALQQGKDIHLITTSSFCQAEGYNWTYDDLVRIYSNQTHPDFGKVKELRHLAKTVFFGSLNGQGAETLRMSYLKNEIEVPLDTCKKRIIGWRNKYPQLANYQKYLATSANKYHFNFNNKIYGQSHNSFNCRGYFMRFPNNKTKKLQVSFNKVCSFAWMSVEKIIMMKAFRDLWDKFRIHPEWEARVVNFVHDEFDILCNSNYQNEVAKFSFETLHGHMANFLEDIPAIADDERWEDAIVDCWIEKK